MRYTFIYFFFLLSFFSCKKEERPDFFSSVWVSKDLNFLQLREGGNVQLGTSFLPDFKSGTLNQRELVIFDQKDTIRYSLQVHTDSLELLLKSELKGKEKPHSFPFKSKVFHRFESWNNLNNWDSLLIQQYYWVKSEKSFLNRSIAVNSTGKIQVKKYFPTGDSLIICEAKMTSKVFMPLRLGLTRISTETFFLFPESAEDQLQMTELTVFSNAEKMHFSGFGIPELYKPFFRPVFEYEDYVRCE